ncbi:MAG: hypothetical protein ABI668_13410 [Sphingorhabdus sp.]
MFEQTFKNIDDVLRKEAGCTTELDYTEQTSWIALPKSARHSPVFKRVFTKPDAGGWVNAGIYRQIADIRMAIYALVLGLLACNRPI